ncbi:amino acid adenylation domain protein [Scytonema sp. HK-05]|uniref:non-ribosomal peptide synthetase n=1 Tax=Scytonema sp. HK-05 TaxID=1137095 RepID=UPI000936741D|nr:non-ribosomal peptide synthetase [Scytonema sp. HK-05]OKH54661.1 non-ribosomal peptide synthetase [Scytonema sp. HK-05]BAY48986.1 amino acid adenylation domain protein [Scytonema sp. HK-05]
MLEEMQGFRLSPQQKHLWQLQEIDNLPYRSQCAVLIEGNLDINTLKVAIEEFVSRHEILRTNFHCLPGISIPFQVIGKSGIFWGENYDWSSYNQQEQEELLQALFHQLNQQPFDLEQGSSLSLSLVTLSPTRYILLICLPALCADAATLKILVREISQFYAACVQDEQLDDEETLQYADLAEWQNELLEGADTEAGRDYWRKQDISALTRLKLPWEKLSAEEVKFQPQTQSFTIAPALVEEIETLSQQYDISVAQFLLACWQVLVWRITKQQDIILGLYFDGRRYQELEAALGLFAKYLPIRINLEAEPEFREILHINHEYINHISKLQDYFNWEQIIELPPSTSCFFPICFEFDEQLEKHMAADVSFSIHQQYACTERFKVKLSCLRQNRTLTTAFHYDSNLFQIEDIKRLAGQFQTLLASVVAHPDVAISQLEILSSSERQQLLYQFNNTERDYSQGKCIHQLFEEQVQRTPNNIAVIFEDQQLTYQELNQQANKIAHYLQKQGVGSEVVVGLCVERSLEMIVGLLGILKAGGAYVPLDTALPAEALALRLQDAQVPVVLTQQQLVNLLPSDVAQVICLDADWEAIVKESDVNPASRVTSENLVYVLFTSGSTGKPKGVAIEHQQLVNYVHAIIERLNLPENANFALVSTFAADLGNTALFPCLSTGGCLHIMSYERATDPAAFLEYLSKHPIDCLKIVPSHLASLLTSSTPQSLIPRERLILGGEVVNWQLIEQTQQYAPDCQIFNHYGPTEATVGVLTYRVDYNELSCHRSKNQNLKSKTVPLGQPIANTQVYVLEEQLQPAPIGVKGEIYIGGATLARCYLNQPELTAVKFIPDPFSNEPGARLYKTGDLGRYLADGTIEFLGRSDYQVKIRGFRVELGEIEAVLSQHPSVREVAVIARDSGSSQKYLAAYIVLSQESPCLVSELRHYVRAKLPEYMMPSTFVILKALPLTPNGKVDRQALPEPDQTNPELEKTFATPRTPIEEVLAGIWARVLGVEQVGIYDNFFELGGHSLLLTQVVSKVREAFQVELALRSLFETPTVAELAQKIETAMSDGQKLATLPIERVKRESELPLSFAQQRLWFLDQLDPGSPSYNISRAILLKGSLNVLALEQSFNEIVRRHEALRTSFTGVNGQPVQVIASALNITLPVVDLRQLPPEEREAEAQRLAKLQAQHSFDLSQSPLLQVTLLWLKENEHILLFTIHHIIADGWSAGVLVSEIATLYESFCVKLRSPLPELSIQYADFAIWQRQWLQTEVRSSQMAYWKQQLGGNLPVLELPSERPRPVAQTFTGKTQSWQIPKNLTEALKSLSQQEAVTLFMTLLAAFKTLLYRYTGQTDILVGSPIANRNRSEIEGLIGFFVNTLVLRTDLSGNLSFRELLRRIREVTLDAYAHQDLPFEQLVEELQPNRNLTHTPLFQVMFVLQNAAMESLKLSGLSLSPLEVETETARFDLTVSLTDTEQGLIGVFEYNSDLFDTATITRMQGHYQTLLEAIVANPEQRLSNLPILTLAERQQLLVDWNDTQVDYRYACIHQLFEAQVERTPDAVAVVFEEEQLTYQELNARANQVAHYLQTLGVRPEVLVGIYVERSLEMVVGLLGILKAGGAYVPLDPSYPHERLAFILGETKVSVLLTQKKLVAVLPEHKAKVVCLDADWEEIVKQSADNLINKATTENLVYAIYTSGSTGQPKGVQITHGALVNFLSTMRLTLGLTQEDILLSVTTLSFDIAALELYVPLIVGARLVVVSREVATDGTQLLEQLADSKSTVMQATPATWRLLLAAGWDGHSQLKILCGGEALDRSLANQLLERSTQVWNLYGPTETTVWSAVQKVESNKDLNGRDSIVSIGRAIANTQIYLLDNHLQPVPIGVPGELHIGGVGLARGYFNQPELTSVKFIPNPFNQESTSRLYKTGDLARYLPDGNIEFLGRIDNQVKVRGFRIELGEIEAALNQHPGVQTSVAVVWEDEPGDKHLVAYLVLQPEQTVTTNEMRRFLAEKLPRYMVPSAFVMLEMLPLTPNGKVDRRALRAPDIAKRNIEAAFVAPHDPVEEVVAGIWVQVLGVEQVGIYDNFFDLGGHSLLATQVLSRIRHTFQIDLPLRRLFESPTVAGLAKSIQEVIKAQLGHEAPTIKRVSKDGNLPLSFAQERLWFLEQLQPGSSTYNTPAAIRLVGSLNVDALEQSLSEIVRRHEALRTTFGVVDGQPFQTITPTLTVKLPIVDLRKLPEAERETEIQRLSAEEFQRSFDLDQGPLLRCTLLHIGEQEHIALFTIHHIVSDGWSMGVFVRELAALYRAFSAGKPSPLPELPIQYADFAVWQRQWLQGEVLQAQLAYWKKQLGNNLPVLQLPTTRPRTEVKTSRGGAQSFVIPSTLSAALQTLSRQEGATLFMTLLAGFQVLLQRYANQDDIVVGTDVANRNRAETESLIGFFVNLLVLRTDLSGNPSFQELLLRVREVTLEAYAHQDLPFEKLVEALRPERSLSNTSPLFQVLFVLQNASMPALELPGLTLSQLEVENKIARFDLALFLTETEQGIVGKWQYNADLFDDSTIKRMTGHFEMLLNSIVAQPDARINTLEMLTETERQQQAMQKSDRQAFKRQKFISIAPKAVSLSQTELIKTGYLQAGATFPLVIHPNVHEIDFLAWAKSNREFVETQLFQHGAILFRGFNVGSVSQFESFAQAICPELFGEYGDLPRAGLGGKVYGSTPYPSDKAILFHNESSHLHQFPLKIWFFCVQPALQGGETPIVDCRKAYQLLEPKLRERLAQKQLMYVRNYTDSLDVSWQEFFHTNEKSVVENYCRRAKIDFEWYDNNGLVTRQIRPALAAHPKTGAQVFFNQIQLHHIAYLEPDVRDSLLSLFGETKLPRNVYYGDGTPIENSVIEQINEVYQQSKTSFPWQQGDILMLDNMLAAHGRNAYVGERKIVVAMGEMFQNQDIASKSV